MAEKPILFSGPMVRALLEGRKTQTRRVLKLPKWASADPNDIEVDEHGIAQVIAEYGCLCDIPVPYAVGDLLWVRESWCELDRGHRFVEHRREAAYMADTKAGSDGDEIRKEYGYKWKPSIHMPRWASRLTLDVTNVRVERLQDISEADAEAEGVFAHVAPHSLDKVFRSERGPIARRYFSELWTSINGAIGPASWGDNPWVVALTFTVHKCNVDSMPQRVKEVA